MIVEKQYKTKICTKCNVEKRVIHFYRSVSGKHGRRSVCKPCCYIQTLENRLLKREYYLMKAKEYESRPEVIARKKEYEKAYRKTERGKKNSMKATALWRKLHPEKYKAQLLRRKLRNEQRQYTQTDHSTQEAV